MIMRNTCTTAPLILKDRNHFGWRRNEKMTLFRAITSHSTMLSIRIALKDANTFQNQQKGNILSARHSIMFLLIYTPIKSNPRFYARITYERDSIEGEKFL